MKKNQRTLLLASLLVVAVTALLILIWNEPSKLQAVFNAERAYQDVLMQTNLGPRTPGSEAHARVIEYITSELKKSGWKVEIQNSEKMGHSIQNIVARRGTGSRWIILGAHYDSRLLANEDANPTLAAQPVPGANDGASGVAVLLEIARTLPKKTNENIWLVFFDAEDQGKIPGWDWILGSQAFAESLTKKPDAVVVIDMIGDADLNIYREKGSNIALTDQIWQTAADLGFSGAIINQEKYAILDDHIPFIEAGIPAIDIIDMDYPYWHTSEDTADKVSPKSLEIIGTTLLTWLEK